MATWKRLARETHNPTLQGDQRFERADEVQNPKEVVFFSRERECVHGGATLRRQVVGQLAANYKKRVRGWSVSFFVFGRYHGQETSEGRKPKEASGVGF
jgi:hypothetical protein